eukprot:XP_008186008.1 PREDICTED: uncharacterized protein LOC100573369 [Acyrthosiphon pisum]
MTYQFIKFAITENRPIRPEQILCDVLDEDGIESQIYVSKNQLIDNGISIPEIPDNNNSSWSDGATSFMLEKYAEYLPKVGPLKLFLKKKDLWQQISVDLINELNVTKNAIQVENRYKTIIKRKKNAIDHNNISGNSRIDVPFEKEIKSITALDDSIEPEVLRNSNIVKKRIPDEICKKKDVKRSKTDMAEVFLQIQREKEEAKERRRKEKMSLIEKILSD